LPLCWGDSQRVTFDHDFSGRAPFEGNGGGFKDVKPGSVQYSRVRFFEGEWRAVLHGLFAALGQHEAARQAAGQHSVEARLGYASLIDIVGEHRDVT